MIFRVSSAHEEGGERGLRGQHRSSSSATTRAGCRRCAACEVETVAGRFEPVEGSEFELPCQLVLLAMGFLGPQRDGLLEQLGVELDGRGNVARDESWRTSRDGVFVCGDMGRGQCLIVWAIAEGRSCAAAVDQYLMGDTALPAPVDPTARPLV